MSSAQTGPSADFVKNLFSSIASDYDQANDLITFGMARRWRRKLVNWSDVKPGNSVLDCATGTGDLALDFKKVVGEKGDVIGSDFCQEMIDLAPKKSAHKDLKVKFELADVTQLQYEDSRFDVVSIAYGIRNVSNLDGALREMARVCKPGGRVMILETGAQSSPLLRVFLRFYCNYLVPLLGGWVSGNRKAYEYLNQSSSEFPSREQFLTLLDSTGCFKSSSFRSILGGASYIYKAVVQ